jgi:hypothetical protein
MFYQQGDVIIESSKIPANAKQKQVKNRVILAEGETTGHAHAISDIDNCQLFETDTEMYLRVVSEVALVHEEHHKQTIPPGEYKIRKVQEYDHFAKEARNVQD